MKGKARTTAVCAALRAARISQVRVTTMESGRGFTTVVRDLPYGLHPETVAAALRRAGYRTRVTGDLVTARDAA